MRGHSTAARLIQSQRRKSSLKEREDVISVFLTEEAEQLEPAEVLLAAVLLLLAVCRQVPQMMKLKQVDDSDVDQLLSAEGFLQDQPLHTAQFTQSSTDAPSPRPSLSLSPPLSPHPAPLSTPHPSPPPLHTQPLSPPHLELLLQFLPQSVQFIQTLAQVNVTVELDEGSDEV